jgi:hypothetical protein
MSIVCFGAAGVLIVPFVRACDQLERLILPGLFSLFGLAVLRVTEVTFDKVGRTCDVRRFDVTRLRRTRFAFSDIIGVKVETGPSQLDSWTATCRLSLVTNSSFLPLTAGYEPNLDCYIAMRDTIIAVSFGDAPRPAAPDPVAALVREGRSIDAAALLQEREGLTLTAAMKRVADLRKTQVPCSPVRVRTSSRPDHPK